MEAVIFDWSGTAVDYGCFAPVKAFLETFEEYGIHPTLEETRKPMGMLKRDHLCAMLAMPRIGESFEQAAGRPCVEQDIDRMYETFEKKLFGILSEYSGPLPFVLDTVRGLRARGVKIGSTTGYTDRMMELVVPAAKRLGYEPDLWVTPDSAGGFGRPRPYMIFRNLEQLRVTSVRKALKVGDTVSDILEGKNAGVWTAGVVKGSSELGLSAEEFEALPPDEALIRMRRVCRTFTDAGADFVIQDMSELIPLIEKIDTGIGPGVVSD